MPRRKQFSFKQIHADWWDAHETVLIRAFRAGDEDWIQDHAASVASDLDGDQTVDMAIGTIRHLSLVRGIESWTFTDSNGQPIPFPPLGSKEAMVARRAALKDLAPEDTAFIYAEINQLNQPMSPEEKKDSPTPAMNGSVANLTVVPAQS